MMSKQALRQLIRQRKQQGSADESAAIIRHLKDNCRFAAAHTLLLYSALPDEVQTQELLDELSVQGKVVLLPRVTSDTDMELRRYTGRHDLQRGAFGILEPVGDVFSALADIDVAVIPGMAFDSDGHRLGRGKGYYDRFLAQCSSAARLYKIGVCFSWQVVSRVPTDEHDIPMDCVISRNGHL